MMQFRLAGSSKPLTEEEIRRALENSDSSNDERNLVSECNSDSTDSDQNGISDSEEDILETDFAKDDEQNASENEETAESRPLEGEDIYIAKDGTEWMKVPYRSGRIPRHNIIRGGIHKVKLPPGKHVDTVLDAFSLFYTDDVINIIVEHTNSHGTKVAGNKWKMTDSVEIRALIGLFLNAGVSKQGIADYNEFWNPLLGSPIFRATMSRDRFVSLVRHLRFDDSTTRSVRRSQDKFAPIRQIWDIINKNLLKHYLPGQNLTIDEQLVPFRGRVSFRQYIPSKPDKYGMKIFWICDSTTSYPLYGVPY